jgi:Flp pilus assembly protein TadD
MRALLAVAVLCGSAALAAEKKTPGFRITPVPQASPVIVEQRKEAQNQHASALKLLTDGKLADARTAFQKVLNLSPNNPAALINLGIVEQRLKNYSEAERLLRRAVQAAPTSGAGWLLLGVVSLEQGKHDAAFAHFAQAAYLAPQNAQPHMYLAVALARKGWNEAAESEFRTALEIDERLADAHYNLAVLYLQHTPPAVELARRHYQRALDLGANPDPSIAAKFTD